MTQTSRRYCSLEIARGYPFGFCKPSPRRLRRAWSLQINTHVVRFGFPKTIGSRSVPVHHQGERSWSRIARLRYARGVRRKGRSGVNGWSSAWEGRALAFATGPANPRKRATLPGRGVCHHERHAAQMRWRIEQDSPMFGLQTL